MRLIDADTLEKSLKKLWNIHTDQVFSNKDVWREIENAPTAEPERKWIPVTEALPEEKEMVLITNNKGHVRCGQYQGTFDDKNYRWLWKHNTLEEVLAWMPLPEVYGGKNE